MTTLPDPSFDQRIADWLERDPNAAPDAVLDTVLAALPSVPQRRRGLGVAGWRTQTMAPTLKLAIGTAAVLVVVVGAALALQANPRGIGASQTPSPSAQPTASPSPTVRPTQSAAASLAPREVGSALFPRPFSMVVPGDWRVVIDRADVFAVLRPLPNDPLAPEIGIDITIVANVYEDPCTPETGLKAPPIGDASADLAAWMGSLEPLAASTPTPTELAGYPALTLDEAFSSAGCAGPITARLVMWDTDAGWVFAVERKRYFIFEVDGRRIVAVIVGRDETFERDVAEGLAALQTLEFR